MLIVSVTTFDPVVALETTPDETLLTIEATGIAGVSAGFIVEVLGSGRASGADFLLARRAFLVSPAVPAEEFVLPPEVPPPEESEVVPEVEVVPELEVVPEVEPRPPRILLPEVPPEFVPPEPEFVLPELPEPDDPAEPVTATKPPEAPIAPPERVPLTETA